MGLMQHNAKATEVKACFERLQKSLLMKETRGEAVMKLSGRADNRLPQPTSLEANDHIRCSKLMFAIAGIHLRQPHRQLLH